MSIVVGLQASATEQQAARVARLLQVGEARAKEIERGIGTSAPASGSESALSLIMKSCAHNSAPLQAGGKSYQAANVFDLILRG